VGRLGRRDTRTVEREFVAFYQDRGAHLRNTAYLLCGDWHLAEDLTQITFTKLYRSWERIDRHDTLDQFARKVLLRAFLDERRRAWRREYPTEPGSTELDTATHDTSGTDSDLHAALVQLPKRRRAVLILRFWADMSVEQVADAMQCSTGTVKSQTARGLTQLRELINSKPIGTDSTEQRTP
jgi:RNA polymerase sigma-70 factor (sigma-E family)